MKTDFLTTLFMSAGGAIAAVKEIILAQIQIPASVLEWLYNVSAEVAAHWVILTIGITYGWVASLGIKVLKFGFSKVVNYFNNEKED